jgi:hypothetical protein
MGFGCEGKATREANSQGDVLRWQSKRCRDQGDPLTAVITIER